jgi:hypothetical protein
MVCTFSTRFQIPHRRLDKDMRPGGPHKGCVERPARGCLHHGHMHIAQCSRSKQSGSSQEGRLRSRDCQHPSRVFPTPSSECILDSVTERKFHSCFITILRHETVSGSKNSSRFTYLRLLGLVIDMSQVKSRVTKDLGRRRVYQMILFIRFTVHVKSTQSNKAF